MKSKSIKRVAGTLVLGIIATILVISTGSCTKKILFMTSSVVPAAEGNVTISRDANQNYVIKMQISNLAAVERLEPPMKSYVVWVRSGTDYAENKGRIITSNNLNVSFETVSPSRPDLIFITAEEDETTQFPSSMIVLTTEKF